MLLATLCAGCATTQLTNDLRAVEGSVGERAGLEGLQLPSYENTDEVDAEVDRLLARPLTANEAAKVALLANRDARVALARVGVARGDLLQAGLVPNPEAEFSIRDPGGPQPAQIDLGLEYSITGAVLAPLRASVAEAALEAERLKASGALLDVVWQAKSAFYEMQGATQRLKMRVKVLSSEQASYATAQELFKVGNLPALSLANALAAAELARLQVAESENALVDAREALSRAMGLTGHRTQWALVETLDPPGPEQPVEKAESTAVAASLELAELERRAESARRRAGLSSTEGWLPHLTGGFHGERDGDFWELGAHMTVSLPVFDRAQGKVLAAKSDFAALRAQAESAAINLRSMVRATLTRVESSGRRARHLTERLLPARKAQLTQTVAQYNAMQLGVFEVLAVQRQVTESELMAIDTLVEHWKARASLELLLAGRRAPLTNVTSTPSASTAEATAH